MKKNYLLILAAGILWGTMSLFVRKLSEYGFSSMQMVAIRTFGTALITGIFLLFTDKDAFKIHISDLWIFLGMGLVSILCFNFCYFNAILEISASAAAILLYTSPMYVMIFARIFFKEYFTKQKVFALFLAVSGCVLVAGPVGALSAKGVAFGIASGVLYALYSIFGRFALQKYSSVTSLFYAFLIAFLGTVPFCKPTELVNRVSAGGIKLVLFLILTVIVTTLLPYLCYTKGLSKTEAGRAAVIVSVEPVVATLISVFVFKEGMTLTILLGVLLVIGAIVVLNYKKSQKSIDF